MIDAHVDGPADAQLLEPLHERRLGVAAGGVVVWPFGVEPGDGHVAAPTASGGSSASWSASLGVGRRALDVDLPVAGERDRRAARGELGVASARRTTSRRAARSRSCPVASAICDGERALPDQP